MTWVATSGGAGFVPYAPGHSGTLVAVLLAYGLERLGPLAYGLGLFCVVAFGTLAAELWGHHTGVPDDQRIVIDEVAGYLLTVLFVPRSGLNLLVGFIVFRVLDIWKPGPIRQVDEEIGGGVGVMADDLVAGILGAFIMVVLSRFGLITRLVELG